MEEQRTENREQRLERLFEATAMMRKYQVLYFRNRLQGDLRLAKQWEAVVDKLILQLRDVPSSEPVQKVLL